MRPILLTAGIFPLSRGLALALWLIACVVAAPPCHAQAPERGLMLWKATGEQSDGTAYLLGTIHEAPPDLYPLDAGYMEAFEAADRLVVEMDMAAMNPLDVAQQTRRLSTLPDGVTLREVIGPELWETLLETVQELGIPMLNAELLAPLQPLPVAFMLLEQSLSTVQAERGLGIEAYFLARARERGMPVGELEGLIRQLELFASIPLEQQTRYLAMILEQGQDQLGESYLSLADAWRKGDLESLAELVHIERQSDPALEPFYTAILEGRNPAMAEAVWEYMQDDAVTLVLVGAAHLHGELGILEMLKERGAHIERMPFLNHP